MTRSPSAVLLNAGFSNGGCDENAGECVSTIVGDHIRAFLHMPLDFGSVSSRDHILIQDNEAYPMDPLWLTEELSPWGSDVHVAVDREIPGAGIVKMSGTFLTKVFEGSHRDASQWVGVMDRYVEEKGYEVDKLYFYYATCPRCAKKLGRNRVVLFAKVK